MLYQDKRGRVEDWRQLVESTEEVDDLSTANINTQMETLTLVVKSWLLMGNVRPDMIFQPSTKGKNKPPPRPRITLGGCSPAWGHLFAALACQLMFAVTRTEGLAICTGCGDSYIPTRKPRVDQRQFCEDCKQRGEPLRLASADYRKRKKEEVGKSKKSKGGVRKQGSRRVAP